MIILIRHAVAVPRATWSDEDRRRPLSTRGERQAAGIIERLAGQPVDQVVSSPTLRCRATVGPLAAARGVRVKTSRSLREGHGPDSLDLVLDAVTNLVVCTHGDVFDDVLRGLRRLGWPLPDRPNRAKGGIWLLQRQECRYLPPDA